MSTSERIKAVEKMWQFLQGTKAFGSVWYERARNFVRNLEDRLLKINEDDFVSALNYWQEIILPNVPRQN